MCAARASLVAGGIAAKEKPNRIIDYVGERSLVCWWTDSIFVSARSEAALSLGYTPTKTLWKVVIPQSFIVSLAPIGNYFIAMIKDTALTSVIAVTELLKTASIINSQTFQTTAVYTAAALLYLAMSLPLSRLVAGIERKVRLNA